MSEIGRSLRVRGLVQGVGFRPTVWRLANAAGLAGDVINDGEGVLIRAWGAERVLADFERALVDQRPPLSRIDALERAPLEGTAPWRGFRIAASIASRVATGVVPDAATCPECLAEILDPRDRRHRYPFANCTNCGPRLSIIAAIPYDRANTAMAAFAMCPDCRREYEDPADRRFHAEPIACPACGPRAWLSDAAGREIGLGARGDAIAAAAAMIRSGRILAIKGVGGFHLACDATNAAAVEALRQRKRRQCKPFALMARDFAMVRRHVAIGAAEEAMLRSPAAPILIAERAPNAPSLAPGVAPGQGNLGFMLPYAPLHHLLMRDLDHPIVLTSGNVSDEPQATDNAEALDRLKGIADAWLMHDRAILNRLDDSVIRQIYGAPAILRRARGLAPSPLPLPEGFEAAPRILAMGGELKATFCLSGEGRAIVSQHLGDLEDPATNADYRKALALYRGLFAMTPEIVAVDGHPDYQSTRFGARIAAETGAQLVSVLHHHAHIASVLAEHRRPTTARKVLGVALDGLGMGANGELWGGEFLLADYGEVTRVGSILPAALIGGDRAMREPWRNVIAQLDLAFGWDEAERRFGRLPIVALVRGKRPAVLKQMVAQGLNAPLASSMGRLFDAAAAVLGLCPERSSYEGQGAVEMEALAAPRMAQEVVGYPVEVDRGGDVPRLTWTALWEALLADAARGADRGAIAARFHRGLSEGVGRFACELCQRHGVESIALSGGVVQNRLLTEGLASHLEARGLEVLTPRLLPANDGGLSLGQAVIAGALSGRC